MPEEPDRAIGAIVLVAPEPIEPRLLAQVLEVPLVEVEQRCARLARAYRDEGRGFELARVAGGYRYQTCADLATYVERFVSDGAVAKLSAAALETLAIVAYRQPISRAQISAIRGVNVDGVVRTLVQRSLVAEVGRDPGPGQAVLYGTTGLFLERLGLDRLADLPPLGAHVPGPDVVEHLEAGLRPGDGDVDARDGPAVGGPDGPSRHGRPAG